MSRTIWNAGDQLTAAALNANFPTGGTGADGALTISSGTTTISIASAQILIKNYSSISITSTGKLAFSNPHANGSVVILKSTGNVTLTSSTVPNIDCSSLGAASGSGATGGVNNSQLSGTDGSDANSVVFAKPGKGGGGIGITSSAAGAAPIFLLANQSDPTVLKYSDIFVGAGGGGGAVGSGGVGNGTAGTGGRGGGALIIECAGAWNFTVSGGISVAGANGTNGVNNSGSVTAAGGGGGGGGYCRVMYGALTANSGTITSSGGTGGNNNSGSMGSSDYGGGGGGGQTAGNAGSPSNAAAAKTGGDGASGFSSVSALIFA